MALTTLDPTPALVVIDLRRGLMAVPAVHPIEKVVDRAARRDRHRGRDPRSPGPDTMTLSVLAPDVIQPGDADPIPSGARAGLHRAGSGGIGCSRECASSAGLPG